jgi:DDE family transposase
MSVDSATTRYHFPHVLAGCHACFDGRRMTSDGGLVWLAEAERATGICAALAAAIPDWRRRRARHPLALLVRQRVFQIACGYADQNDATTLRTDPLLKLVCGRPPEAGPDLASQPTLSRLDNAADRRGCVRLAWALAEVYRRERERLGRPAHLVLGLDSTDDPTHGEQEGTAYHGYYRQHMYHPLLIFDGQTHQLVTALLRPGQVHASRGAVSVLRHLVAALRRWWPGVTIEVRGDSGFGVPAVYRFCERAGIAYTLGLATNPRLRALAAPLLAQAQAQHRASGQKVRLAGEASYQAESWPHPRRVVFKAEVLPKGPNTRFVVTSRADAPLALYAFYVDRGEAENWIKDLKLACAADRLSCHRFWANQFRLFLHAAAYWLLDTLRRWLAQAHQPPTQLDSLRRALLKIGGYVWQFPDRSFLRLASSPPAQHLWDLLTAHAHADIRRPILRE